MMLRLRSALMLVQLLAVVSALSTSGGENNGAMYDGSYYDRNGASAFPASSPAAHYGYARRRSSSSLSPLSRSAAFADQFAGSGQSLLQMPRRQFSQSQRPASGLRSIDSEAADGATVARGGSRRHGSGRFARLLSSAAAQRAERRAAGGRTRLGAGADGGGDADAPKRSQGVRLTYPANKVALVTGAGSGIGKAIAQTLARGGLHVLCVNRNFDAAKETARGIVEEGNAATAYHADVSHSDVVRALCKEVSEKHGGVDVLVNNAGVTKDNLFMRMSEDDWNTVIGTNLNSAFHFTQPLIRHMSRNRWGRIVNTASVIGVGGNAGQANYAASKAGLIGLTKSIAKEMGAKGITANAIAPGFIATKMTDVLTDEMKATIKTQIPAGRMGTPQEVADLVAFLASDQASYINGHVIPSDGGRIFGYP
eukprot:GHVU01173407.1.p1 GENE.GHVU01173407.1~~GHVU01173407.1.p1  ORF type:complete len:424 (-),score=59.41 GHVU01173407.1:2721-3992(-)